MTMIFAQDTLESLRVQILDNFSITMPEQLKTKVVLALHHGSWWCIVYGNENKPIRKTGKACDTAELVLRKMLVSSSDMVFEKFQKDGFVLLHMEITCGKKQGIGGRLFFVFVYWAPGGNSCVGMLSNLYAGCRKKSTMIGFLLSYLNRPNTQLSSPPHERSSASTILRPQSFFVSCWASYFRLRPLDDL
ncbi:hypothetical protein QM012_009367 [Aureobasidium pullulans]|uniref:Uncharacterized protein n=1 Tax=Aureobasidium pullulans TaxID=5580 RepID=A0ABR0THR9_AURPU